MQKQPKELKNHTIGLMVGVALFYDGLQFLMNLIPVLGQILSIGVNIFAFGTFWLWFKLHGISFSNAKRGASMGASFLIELIPILNMLPAWTLAVTLIALDTKVKPGSKQKDEGKVVGSIGPQNGEEKVDLDQAA